MAESDSDWPFLEGVGSVMTPSLQCGHGTGCIPVAYVHPVPTPHSSVEMLLGIKASQGFSWVDPWNVEASSEGGKKWC